MAGKERAAAARAVENERRDWLPILEDLATQVPTDDLMGQVILEGEVRRLRRLLGLPLPPTPEAVQRRREQTRDRVRRHRARLRG